MVVIGNHSSSYVDKRFWRVELLGFPDGSVVKNPHSNAEDTCLISGSGGSSGGRNLAIHSSIFASIVSWTEEPGRLQSMEPQKVRHN